MVKQKGGKAFKPFYKKLECECDHYTFRYKSSRKRGVYKVISTGEAKDFYNLVDTLRLTCIVCGRTQIYKVRRQKKWNKKKLRDTTEQKEKSLSK